jgi:hypothetical protein
MAKTRPRFSSEDSTISTMAPRSRVNSDFSTSSNYEEIQEELEELRLDFEEKCNDLVECENNLKAAKMEIQELRILLKNQTGERRCSVVPDTMGTGSGVAGNPQAEELQRIFHWLADQIVLEEGIQFNPNCDLIMADQHVRLRNIVQWRFKSTDLRLSVPEELAAEVSSLISATKMNRNTVCDAKARAIIDSWLLTTSEPLGGTTSAVTLLTHRAKGVSCVVANFPLPPPPPPQAVEEYAGVRVGDIVEVNFEGDWFRGVVKLVENDGIASVQCDADPPGVLTKSPMSFLRHLADDAASQTKPEVANTIPEMQQPQPQVGSNSSVPPSPSGCAQDDIKKTFSHARTFTGPTQSQNDNSHARQAST